MNLAAKTFDMANARACALLAATAYTDGSSLTRSAISVNLISGDQTDTQVLVVEFADFISVNFRGTSNLHDAFTDIQIKRVKIDGGSAHSGFVAAIEDVLPKLRAYLQTLPQFKRLVITGHSLGGALAALFAYKHEGMRRSLMPYCSPELSFMGLQSICAVYTCGKPRVFNLKAQYAYNAMLRSRTYRIVNCGDPIPLMPGLLIGYLHEGTEIFLRPESGTVTTMQVNPSHCWEIFFDAMDLRDDIKERGWLEVLDLASEHHIDFYRSQLEKVCAAP